MKNIIVHYINVNNTTTFNVKPKRVILENLKVENDFYVICNSVINDFESQCRLHKDSFYHLFCPTLEQSISHSDIINSNSNQENKIIEINIFKFLEQKNLKNFMESYKKMLKSINGEKFFEEIDIWLKESIEPHSYAREISYNL